MTADTSNFVDEWEIVFEGGVPITVVIRDSSDVTHNAVTGLTTVVMPEGKTAVFNMAKALYVSKQRKELVAAKPLSPKLVDYMQNVKERLPSGVQ